ncbi:MAG: hypothetical protein FRX49_07582 [Trebouxia sp. A1-2]|nr:MAG: hypothetical protein FRX49_07582 [Trebouxia sp. A1-2]
MSFGADSRAGVMTPYCYSNYTVDTHAVADSQGPDAGEERVNPGQGDRPHLLGTLNQQLAFIGTPDSSRPVASPNTTTQAHLLIALHYLSGV